MDSSKIASNLIVGPLAIILGIAFMKVGARHVTDGLVGLTQKLSTVIKENN